MKLKHYISLGTEPRTNSLRLAALVALGMALGTSTLLATPTGSAAAAVLITPVARVEDPVAGLAQDALSALDGAGGGSNSSVYADKRDEVASAIAARLSTDPAGMIAAWSRADLKHQQALLTGLTQLGVPYRKNTSTPGVGFDCSGLTTFAWAGAGLTLVRQSSAQMQAASPRTVETAQAGDLMQYPGHVMMWLGVGRAALQAPNPGRTVEVVLYRAGRRVRVGDPTG